jgi:hypothetical protein
MTIVKAVQEFAQRLAEMGLEADDVEIVLPDRAWNHVVAEMNAMEMRRPMPSFMGEMEKPANIPSEPMVVRLYTVAGPIVLKRIP